MTQYLIRGETRHKACISACSQPAGAPGTQVLSSKTGDIWRHCERTELKKNPNKNTDGRAEPPVRLVRRGGGGGGATDWNLRARRRGTFLVLFFFFSGLRRDVLPAEWHVWGKTWAAALRHPPQPAGLNTTSALHHPPRPPRVKHSPIFSPPGNET